MKKLLRRPAATFTPGNGLLRNDHFQVAYVTNDLDSAAKIFSERYGIKEFRRLEGQLPAGGDIRVDLAWVGGIMFELVQASGPGSAFYTARLPTEGFAIKHHHLGYFVHEDADWQALVSEIEAGKWDVAFKAEAPGFIRAWYIEAPELGHYLEYIYLEEAGIAFFEAVPGT